MLARVWSFRGVTPAIYNPDSLEYERIAHLPLLGESFFRASKPWGVPLFYKLLPGSTATAAPIAQLAVSIACWLALAAVVAASMQTRPARSLAFVSILVLSSMTFVTEWDGAVLSESLSLSLSALLVALILLSIRRPRAMLTVLVVVVAFLWSATRDTNAFLLPAITLPLAAVWLRRGRRRLPASLVLSTLLIVVFSFWSAASFARWQLLVIDAIDERVLSSPSATQYFQERGMPTPPELRRTLFAGRLTLRRLETRPELREFNRWFRAQARPTYTGYLLSHPSVSLEQPLRALPDVLAPPGLDFYLPHGMRASAPRAVEQRVYPGNGRWIVTALAVALGLLVLAWASGAASATLIVPASLLVSLVPHAVVVWDGEPTSLGRHALLVGVLARLGLLIAFLGVLDHRLARARRVLVPRTPGFAS